MNAYVITCRNIPQSVEAAERCVESAARFDIDAELFSGVIPASLPLELIRRRGWSAAGFQGNPYSRLEPCVAAFLSHSNLWKLCEETDEPLIVCEHDCVFTRHLPDLSLVTHLCNLGAPSFGSFKTPRAGLGPLVSKPHLPGAHCYYVTPAGARSLLRHAERESEPTDVYVSTKRFPWLQEAFPWPAQCVDDFSLIQLPRGCVAKHRPVVVIG